jgi:predicted glycogen debranching enzyme
MRIAFGPGTLHDFDAACRLEWLEPSGVGGWASSTVAGAHTRRYHGLLVAATTPPTGRLVLLSRLDETVVAGGDRYELGANRFPGAVAPAGHLLLESFERELVPVWTYRLGDARLRRTVAAVHGEATTVVLYELDAPAPVALQLRPFVAARDYHALQHANDAIRGDAGFEEGTLTLRPYDSVPELALSAPGAAFEPAPDWWRDFEYDRERERGLDFREDLFTPGVLVVTLEPGFAFGVVVSTERRSGDALALVRAEFSRREELVAGAPDHELARALTLAADAYLVRRRDGLSTVVAGYHWFTDWGRDTMIALPGLALATGRFDEAREILRAFAASASEGMIPNRFADAGEAVEYNTVDATLWFFVAAYRYLEATGDEGFVLRELLPVFRDSLGWHRRGTRFGIRVERDGLLRAGEPGVQLTWMDAKVGEWVVTPRIGKPVEVNALWVNALRIAARLEELAGEAEACTALTADADRAEASFVAAFWNEDAGYLFDVVDGDERDASIRPNALLALSLPFPLLDGERAERVLAVAEERLATPVGLRTLDPADPAYRGRYAGGAAERDGAYHQGTAWPWLLGPYVDALLRVRGAEGAAQAAALLAGLPDELRRAGLGHLPEIYDGDEPRSPHGCIAQAWSVAEVLRVQTALAAAVLAHVKIL